MVDININDAAAIKILDQVYEADALNDDFFVALERAKQALIEKNENAKRGEWIRVEDKNSYWYECSCCHAKNLKGDYGEDVFSAFCPSCGATLSGVNENYRYEDVQ